MTIEMRCTHCDETFVVTSTKDIIHYERSDGETCGGTGVLQGAWK